MSARARFALPFERGKPIPQAPNRYANQGVDHEEKRPDLCEGTGKRSVYRTAIGRDCLSEQSEMHSTSKPELPHPASATRSYGLRQVQGTGVGDAGFSSVTAFDTADVEEFFAAAFEVSFDLGDMRRR